MAEERDQSGYAIIPRWLLYSTAVSPHAKLTYVTIQSHVNAHATAWPTRATIAEESGMSDSTVKRAIRELEDLGVIEVRRRKLPNGRQTSNVYRVLITLPGAGDEAVDEPVG